MAEINVPMIDMQAFPDEKEYIKLRDACKEWGSFRITNHGVPFALMAEMKKVVRSLLDLPLEVKTRNTSTYPGGSYIPTGVVHAMYEALALHDIVSTDAVNDFCSKLDASPHQREIIEKYGKAVEELAMDLGQRMAESIGLKGNYFKGWPLHMRMNGYSFNSKTVGTPISKGHTDASFLTLIQDDENVGGHEVLHIRSRAFVPVNPCAGSFLVNLGDIAQVWSNGKFLNVEHRVVCREPNPRLSIAAFLIGPPSATIEAPTELVDSENPRLFAPFTYEEYTNLLVYQNIAAGRVLQVLRA